VGSKKETYTLEIISTRLEISVLEGYDGRECWMVYGSKANQLVALVHSHFGELFWPGDHDQRVGEASGDT